MPMYNLIEYSENYSKTSGSLWQYCKEIPAINNNGAIVDCKWANATDSFKACVCFFCQIFIFSPNDTPSKTVKNAFYFF